MLRDIHIARSTGLLAMALLLVVALAASAPAQQIDVSLNLLYSDPTDLGSGGDWELAVKTSHAGLAGLQVYLTGIDIGSEQNTGPQGFVNGSDEAGFSVFLHDDIVPDTILEIAIGQAPVAELGGGEEQSVFYGVGTVGNDEPEDSLSYTSLTGTTNIPWDVGDFKAEPDWDWAAVLVTGTFGTDMLPEFYTGDGLISSGTVYPTVGTSTSVPTLTLVDPLTSMIVRTNLTISGLLGDYNDDGKVDAADYTVWRDAQEAAETMLTNRDPTLTGLVSEDDYTVWRENFGAMVMPGAGSSAGAGGTAPLGAATVPEPATSTLLVGALAMLLLRPKIGHFSNIPRSLKKRYSAWKLLDSL